MQRVSPVPQRILRPDASNVGWATNRSGEGPRLFEVDAATPLDLRGHNVPLDTALAKIREVVNITFSKDKYAIIRLEITPANKLVLTVAGPGLQTSAESRITVPFAVAAIPSERALLFVQYAIARLCYELYDRVVGRSTGFDEAIDDVADSLIVSHAPSGGPEDVRFESFQRSVLALVNHDTGATVFGTQGDSMFLAGAPRMVIKINPMNVLPAFRYMALFVFVFKCLGVLTHEVSNAHEFDAKAHAASEAVTIILKGVMQQPQGARQMAWAQGAPSSVSATNPVYGRDLRSIASANSQAMAQPAPSSAILRLQNANVNPFAQQRAQRQLNNEMSAMVPFSPSPSRGGARKPKAASKKKRVSKKLA